MSRKRTRGGRWIVVVVAGLCASAGPVVAQGAQLRAQVAAPAQVSDSEQRLRTEAGRLRSELERTNADISSLKRSGPGVRNDYRLHRRQADAEQLARQLTAVEAKLRQLRAGVPARLAQPVPAEAAEAPAALEARADLLSDEARRLSQQAGGLARAAGELRSRQTLLRRSGQIERDPFAAMDASKRFMVLQSNTPTRATDRAGANRPTTPESGTPPAGDPVTSTGAPPPPPPATVAPPVPPAPTTPGGASGSQPATPPAGLVPTSGPTGPQGFNPLSSAAPRAALLDPVALGERRGAERADGKPISEIERLERRAAELKSRARDLEVEAQTLRTRAAKR